MHVYMYSLLLSIVFHDREKLGRRWTYGCHGRTVSEGSSGREPSRGVRYTAAGNRSQERGGSEGGVHRFGGIWFCELDVLSDRLTFDIWCWGSLRQQLANQMASNGATWPYLTSIIFEFEFRKIVLVCAEMTHHAGTTTPWTLLSTPRVPFSICFVVCLPLVYFYSAVDAATVAIVDIDNLFPKLLLPTDYGAP